MCNRCRKRLRNLNNSSGWNVVFDQGRPVGFLCPSCQTPEENAESVINEAALDYSRTTADPSGRLIAPLKTDPYERGEPA